MYRQQAERLAAKLRSRYPKLSIEVYEDGGRPRWWLVNAYDPVSRRTSVYETERDAIQSEGQKVAV